MKKKQRQLLIFHSIKPNFRYFVVLLRFFLFLPLLLFSNKIIAQDLTVIKGVITSEKGELLSGVTIQVKDTRLITQTNREGEYLLNKVPLNATLIFSRLGYKDLSLDFGLLSDKDNIQNIILITDIQSLDEVHITERFNSSNSISIEAAKFSSFPQTSGSFESFIKNLPGVSGNNELSSQYSVRGGNFDENLIYLNDVEIFRPMLIRSGQQEGLGFINPDLASSIFFSAGGFEARYGDKLSSILDVRYSKPDSLSLEAQAGFLSSSATLKLPLKNGFFLAGIRNKKNQSFLGRQNIEGEYHSGFSDYQFLLRQNISSKLNLSLFGLYNGGEVKISPDKRITEFGTSDDVLRLFVNYEGEESSNYNALNSALTFSYNASNSLNFKWINSIASINVEEQADLLGWYSFNEKEGGGLNPSNGGSLLGMGSNQTFSNNYLKSLIYNTELRMYKQVKSSFFEMGVRFQSDRIDDRIDEYTAVDTSGYAFPDQGNWMYSGLIDQQNLVKIRRFSGFVQNTFSLRPNLMMAAGVRLNYNTYSKENMISPRVSLMYNPGHRDHLLIRFSAGTYNQAPFYREIKNYNGSLNAAARSQRSFQLITGTDYKFNGLGTRLKFSSEVYYKILSRITPYKIEDLKIRYLSDKMSKGYAAGADLSISGNFAKDLESTFRISVMKTEEDIKDDFYLSKDAQGNQITIRPGYLKRPTDQLFNIGMMFQDRLIQNPTYKVHLNLIYSSSLPVGPPGPDRHTDQFKIPAYKRADIGFSKDLADPEGKRSSVFIKKYFQALSLHAELFNLLNFKNTTSYLWLNDKMANQYAVPNYLTSRMFNFRVIAKLKSR
ncbi:TonB-dependent receptor [Daejeonella rubra]|uniref:TonB-dependent receptor n=1 Tax=Daejeonella rubra TaxID=990371 RepID=UPI00115FC7C7|nr:TonB-dependent receptor [Daejeonella rubra]